MASRTAKTTGNSIHQSTRACRKSSPYILVMQSTEDQCVCLADAVPDDHKPAGSLQCSI